jgi:hypothetical protein
VEVALCTVGAEDAGAQLTTMVLSLSVKVTESFEVVRDQPSGVEILKAPAFERYGTNAMLSGMSPGGLLSAGTGDSGGTGETCDRAGFGDRVADGEALVPLEDGPPAVAELPQALNTIAHIAIAATAVAVDRVGPMLRASWSSSVDTPCVRRRT